MTYSTQSSSTLVAIRRDECFFPISSHSISLSSVLSYLIDWIFYISLTTLALVYAKIVSPLFAEFYLYNTSLWYSHIPTDLTIVPTFLLIIYSILIPIGQFALTIGFTTSHRWHRRLWDLHAILLTLMAAHALQTVIVSLLKNLVGAPRPDMLARCRPMSWMRPSFGTLSNVGICTQTDIGHLEEGFRSFPSAHSATAFTSAMVQVLFWIARTRMLDCSGWSWKLLLSLVPLLSASAVAFSRISDNRHHVFDVIIGMLIGLIAGYLAFIHYFPFPTFANVCTGGRAYSPRCGILGSVGCWSLGDETGCLRTKLFKTPKCSVKATFTMGCGTELCVCKKPSCGACSVGGEGAKCSLRCSIRNCTGNACTSRPVSRRSTRRTPSRRSRRSHQTYPGRSSETACLPSCSPTCTGNCHDTTCSSCDSSATATEPSHTRSAHRCTNPVCTIAGCIGACLRRVTSRPRCTTVGCTVANCIGISCLVGRVRTCRIPWCRNERCMRLAREHCFDEEASIIDVGGGRSRASRHRRVSRHAITP
ncbi:YALI0C11297p [Yarrowia lipolytica CLIB122]|uniref:YALI0C11297p n=2 Tax=Yarrowia lipolytica TaxID=4952 RepID=Q6CC96_YARLI|nr:YALI0C11297p [Yarrowia lipolytica CLIB122]AOW02688.1 hypothetical protein YALI1_C15776g [Yarrowia lipolytica]KAB8282429.1 phosphatidic acid phosphatase type 2/haloperoxidase [Yarrowia lipolytica]KAE8169739.1 phosphatidic acid phosphatase type 2/haloperoxidase [Yarrowia lipolytica]KAJ8053334.1 phosphatidic acid phosphatase type 2/haloperoxidase [Yarrowia lipolytica]RMI95383.1 phosphatidic acid phosphatase type 2/haloperoxidase [Yarrowia lipolytica]|eukprot:XP_501716.1 YALI0C11297p [Yarrowia lipolytica CLIB122]